LSKYCSYLSKPLQINRNKYFQFTQEKNLLDEKCLFIFSYRKWAQNRFFFSFSSLFFFSKFAKLKLDQSGLKESNLNQSRNFVSSLLWSPYKWYVTHLWHFHDPYPLHVTFVFKMYVLSPFVLYKCFKSNFNLKQDFFGSYIIKIRIEKRKIVHDILGRPPSPGPGPPAHRLLFITHVLLLFESPFDKKIYPTKFFILVNR